MDQLRRPVSAQEILLRDSFPLGNGTGQLPAKRVRVARKLSNGLLHGAAHCLRRPQRVGIDRKICRDLHAIPISAVGVFLFI